MLYIKSSPSRKVIFRIHVNVLGAFDYAFPPVSGPAASGKSVKELTTGCAKHAMMHTVQLQTKAVSGTAPGHDPPVPDASVWVKDCISQLYSCHALQEQVKLLCFAALLHMI